MLNNELHMLEFKKPIQACFLGKDFVISFEAEEEGSYTDLVINAENVRPIVTVVKRQKTEDGRRYKQCNFDFFD